MERIFPRTDFLFFFRVRKKRKENPILAAKCDRHPVKMKE
jgi:hypothetical protein